VAGSVTAITITAGTEAGVSKSSFAPAPDEVTARSIAAASAAPGDGNHARVANAVSVIDGAETAAGAS
jgi:hypothetical protein